MTENSPVHQVIRRYHTALKALDPNKAWDDRAVLEVLKARDGVLVFLDEITADPARVSSPDTELLLQLAADDVKLAERGDRIATHPSFSDWRKSFNPPENAWWWNFTPPPDRRDRWDWLWSSLTVTALAGNLAFVSDIAMRFLAGSPGVLSSFAAISPGILTLFASGGALTKVGRQAIEHLLERRGTSKHYWHEVKLALSLGLLAILFGFHAAFPQIASLYNREGRKQFNSGNLASAWDNFARALNLNPDYPEAQFYLGRISEEWQEIKQAQTEYRRAIEGGYLPAYNNLARIYLTENENGKAIALLNQAIHDFDLQTDPPELQYALYKNRGWARLQKKQFSQAQTQLEQALKLNPERAEAHCLLALALEGKEEIEVSLIAWERCLRYLPLPFDPQTDRWIDMANQRLETSP